jgi:hypothetical protein
MIVSSLVIMVEVDSSFWSIKTDPKLTVQASSKPYEFLDIDCLYSDGSYIYITPLGNLK